MSTEPNTSPVTRAPAQPAAPGEGGALLPCPKSPRGFLRQQNENGNWRVNVHAEFKHIHDTEKAEHQARKALYAAALSAPAP